MAYETYSYFHTGDNSWVDNTDNSSLYRRIYTDNTIGTIWVDLEPCKVWEGSVSGISVAVKDERKEGLTVKKQTFIEALMDEGVTLTAKERKLIREASSEDWDLFIARLLTGGGFSKALLEVLKPEPETVIVKREK